MTFKNRTLHPIARAASAFAIGCGATLALAAEPMTTPHPGAASPMAPGASAAPMHRTTVMPMTPEASAVPTMPARTMNRTNDRSDEAATAHKHVEKTIALAKKMEADPALKALMQKAKGIFFVPDYGRAALIIGGQGGAGVLVVRHAGQWAGPGFYNFGGVSIGAQAGVSGGEIAMLLMDDKAVNSFAQGNKFSLNADAGLTVVDYSKRAHGEAGRGDVIVWSGTKGAFANLSISVTDVNYDENETHAYYGQAVTPKQIVDGTAHSAKSEALMKALPAG